MPLKASHILLVSLCLISSSAFAQIKPKPHAFNAFYLEALGAGGYGSVNYERLLFQQKKLHTIREHQKTQLKAFAETE